MSQWVGCHPLAIDDKRQRRFSPKPDLKGMGEMKSTAGTWRRRVTPIHRFEVLLLNAHDIRRVANANSRLECRLRTSQVRLAAESRSRQIWRSLLVRWVNTLRDKLQPLSLGLYVNALSETSDQLVRAGYGPNYARLAEIKKKYDPTNVLRLNQNIKPN